MKEIWKPVVGYEGLYEVSSLGKIRSLDRTVLGRGGCFRRIKGRIVKEYIDEDGRALVGLWKLNKGVTRFVCHIVLEAFVGPRPPGHEACHFPDINPANNAVSNLRWDTSAANKEDSRKHGTLPLGERKYQAKIKDEEVPKIFKRLYEGEHNIEVAESYGVHVRVISDIRNGLTYKHVECEYRGKVGKGRPGARGKRNSRHREFVRKPC